jgi:hypothetical protein
MLEPDKQLQLNSILNKVFMTEPLRQEDFLKVSIPPRKELTGL